MYYFARARVEAFSDGVFAIIVTLLVLEIKVPTLTDHQSIGELGQGLLDLFPKVFSWMISFLIVCVIWVNHHRLFNQLAHITQGIFWLNANLLMWCSFIPFPTALLGEYLHNPLSGLLFGLVMAIASLSFTILRWHVQNRPTLLKSSVDQLHFRQVTSRSVLFGFGLYIAGGLLSFVSPWLAWLVFSLIPLYFIFFNTAEALPEPESEL